MEDKINIAKLLKDCPKGMELDCTCADNVTFDEIIEYEQIKCRIGVYLGVLILDKYGRLPYIGCPKCVIFPKGKTTWEGFVPPCKFNAGDVLVSETGNIVLFSHIDSKGVVHYHCIIPDWGSFRIEENTSIGVGRYYDCILANEEQRQRMYDKIKCSGYKYNQQLNKLEKLVKPKFKVGDKIKDKNNKIWFIVQVSDKHFDISLIPNAEGYFVPIEDQDDYELVPNKFDITTLKPFESRVLMRDKNTEKWVAQFFSHYNNGSDRPYTCIGCEGLNEYKQCIPYEGNEHLLNTTNNCDEYYKTWEK